MPIHLRTLPQPTCAWDRCGRAATQRLHNHYGAQVADYCDRHATSALRAAWAANPDQAPKDWDAPWRSR